MSSLIGNCALTCTANSTLKASSRPTAANLLEQQSTFAQNDYDLDDDGDDDAYEATNQFVGASVSGKTCDVDNVTALACDHVRQESLLWTK